jgi:hypothetical protein
MILKNSILLQTMKRHLAGKALEDYKKTLKLTDLQKDVLVGTLLGDASMSLRNGKPHYSRPKADWTSYSVKFEQGEEHAAYVEHLYDIFEPFTGSLPAWRFIDKQKTRRALWFRTYRHNSFIFYWNYFYGQTLPEKNQRKIKNIPKDIHKFLTARALAYWFMDDGTYNINKSIKSYLLSTQGFKKHENILLCEALKTNFNIAAEVHKDKGKWRIYIRRESSETLQNLIELYVIESLKYKL